MPRNEASGEEGLLLELPISKGEVGWVIPGASDSDPWQWSHKSGLFSKRVLNVKRVPRLTNQKRGIELTECHFFEVLYLCSKLRIS